MITETGDAIVQHLAPGYRTWDLRRFPDDPAAYALKNQKGALLVKYEGRTWSDPTGDEPRHVREIRFELAVITRNLQRKGAEDGAEAVLADLAARMEGAQLGGFTFFPEQDDFVEYRTADGTWFYRLLVVGHRAIRLEGLSS